MSWSLMAHQEEGVAFLLRRGSGLLAFEQGLGKTLVAIAAFNILREEDEALGLLVICPNSLKENWRAEIAKFSPDLSVRVIPSGRRHRRRGLRETGEDVVLINFEGARADILSVRGLMSRRKMVMVVDESHAVKNAKSLTTIAATDFADLAVHRWLLTGTPVTNSPSDIYSQLRIVEPEGPWGSAETFEARYSDAAVSVEAADRLGDLIAPFVLRRTKAECLDLPEKTFVDVPVRLPPWQRALYDDYREGTLRRFEGMSENEFRAARSEAFASLTRLLQIATDPGILGVPVGGTIGKEQALDELLASLMAEPHQKVVLWSDYVGPLRKLVKRYHRYGARAIYGDVGLEDRQDAVDAFQGDERCRLLVANPAAAGTGYTFTAATVAVYYTLSWRYDYFAQSQDRIHRIGQEEPVRYLRLIAQDTIDEAVVEALSRKKAMADSILGDGDEVPTLFSLSAREFCVLLARNTPPGS